MSRLFFTASELKAALPAFPETLAGLLAAPIPSPEEAAEALASFAESVREEGQAALRALGFSEAAAAAQIGQAAALFSRETLTARIRRELPPAETPVYVTKDGRQTEDVSEAASVQPVARILRRPLGVIFHIPAGNTEAVPFYAAAEGLITGNISLVKLPENGDMVTEFLAERFAEAFPALAGRMVFVRYSSRDEALTKSLCDLADAVSVWGGEEAVLGVRRLAGVGTRVIEWGPKISFAYVSGAVPEEELRALAESIAGTEGLLCSSCQGIYCDTADFGEACRFAGRFSAVLEEAYHRRLCGDGRAAAARTLEHRTQTLARAFRGEEAAVPRTAVFENTYGTVTALPDAACEMSLPYGNVWVRPLPQADIIRVLFPYKNRLQSAALLCPEAERERLADTLLRTGMVRVTDAAHLTEALPAMPHDGEWEWGRYVKRAEAVSQFPGGWSPQTRIRKDP